jgi:metal-sulfur cluster biosynthetic enzyme
MQPMTTESEILEALKQVYDPEIGINIVDLGLVYGVDWDEEGKVSIKLTLTTPGCPLGPQMIRDVKRVLRSLDGVFEVDVTLVWSPLWQPSMMSEAAKDELGYDAELGSRLGY